jgi:hypothetical protein
MTVSAERLIPVSIHEQADRHLPEVIAPNGIPFYRASRR